MPRGAELTDFGSCLNAHDEPGDAPEAYCDTCGERIRPMPAPGRGDRVCYQGQAGTIIRLEHVLGAGWERAVIQLDGQTPAQAFSVSRDDLTPEQGQS